ncbi:enolase C-terminal domain-like protein [Jannaschia sp. 2305UL9-9]|uniref:enolase C-terminal domain-like protein n=1 Tax=Jannaschia sp. 2305UL9-9 TaxID=3121638 RepID=UPI0035272791
MRVEQVEITPIAVPDVPLLNTKGVHQQVFLRSIIEVTTDTGITGLAETYGAARTLDALKQTAPHLAGLDVWNLNDLRRRIESALPDAGGINAPTMLADHQKVDVAYSAWEMALLDIQGKAIGRPVSDLLGGAVRGQIGFGAYLFFKFAKPADQVGEDIMGEVMTPDAMVEQARMLVDAHGFRSLKLKGGVLEPDAEVETLLKLRETFPDHPLRIDPMGAWTVPTALRVIDRLHGVLEYLEDPVRGMDAMAELARQTDMPLASNLVTVEFEDVIEVARNGAVQIILSDPHYWRGPTGCRHLGEMCRAAGMGVAMHSNSHLGISMAAMCHVAAATPNLRFDVDTHYPWSRHDVVKGGRAAFADGKLDVPAGPGVGVDLDRDSLTELASLYDTIMMQDRDDTEEMKKYIPDYVRQVPRW